MKLAICLYGEFREFEYTLSSLHLWEKFNPDYYISTWNTSKQISEPLNIKIIEDVDESKILQHIPNARINIQNEIHVENDDINVKLHHHWRNLVVMLKENYLSYDLVIFRRIDLFIHGFQEEIFLNTEFDKNKIFISNGLKKEVNSDGELKPFIDDNLFICEPSSLIKFIDTLPNEIMPSHFGIAKYLTSTDIKIEPINFCTYSILRPIMRPYLTSNYEKNCKFLRNHGMDYNQKWCTHWHPMV